MLRVADVIRMVVRLRADVSGHIVNCDGVVENKINQVSGRRQGTFEAAKQGLQAFSEKAENQSRKRAKMFSNERESFDNRNR